jgi:two-component system LytT family response regulator
VHAIDYLLKPFNQQRLDQAVAHARNNINSPKAMDELVADVANHNKPLARVLIRDGAKVHIIAASKIDYVEAQDDYVQIRSEGKSYLKNQRLSELEEQLESSQFLRVHRSYLLNIERIVRIEQYAKDSHNAVLQDDTRIPISRSGYQKVKNLIR